MMPNIKYQPGDRVCFIKDKMIIMAKVNVTFYDTEAKVFKFLLYKFAKEFMEDELFFNFHDAQKFMEKESDQTNED